MSSAQLNKFIESSGMYLIPYGDTYHLRNSSSFFDLCFIDNHLKLVDFGQRHVCFLSAHNLINYKVKICRRVCGQLISRSLSHAATLKFQVEIQNADWSLVYLANFLDDKVDMFTEMLLTSINRHAPLQNRTFKNLLAPWLTSDIENTMRLRDKARRLWHKRKDPVSYDEYNLEIMCRILLELLKPALSSIHWIT